MKKALSLMLVLVMAAALLVCPAMADGGNGSGGGNGQNPLNVASVKIGDRNLILAVEMGRIAVKPDMFAVCLERIPHLCIQRAERFQCFINAAANRCDKLNLILAEIACDMRIIAERMRRLCQTAEAVHAQRFTLNAEFPFK